MGFRINTNVGAMNAHANATMNNRNIDNSLSKLSSGLRINTASDDASGMAIADALRSQASSLGQAVSNANDGISIVQIADKAMDEQIKILDTIKTKATQAAQDGQTASSRKAIQADIGRLMESLDNIANTTSYNGQNLLAGGFTNKEFQVGAYSNQTVTASIGNTTSSKIGTSSFATGVAMSAEGAVSLVFSTGTKSITMAAITVSNGAANGINKVADAINNISDQTGVRASYRVETVMSEAIAAGSIEGLTINGIVIGAINSAKANDSDGQLVNAINAVKDLTGVEASVDQGGSLHLKSMDGRAILLSASAATTGITQGENIGQLTLSRLDARAIVVSGTGAGVSTLAASVLNLGSVRGNIESTDAKSIGANAYSSSLTDISTGIGAGVTSLRGAMATMTIAESATKLLDKIRSDLGSVQNQLVSTVNNITVTQVNVKAAESQIRDVDFAAESANFSKFNILAQSGSYAMSQANATQQNVLRLLQ
ncbi:MAG: flagellin B [Sulfuricurvum sp.]|jgi:flagellin|uniref:flagellin B n=1 Tax=Sulfuricurvum sp. TaxID=2025608 RepID=UPI0025DF8E37|nr:flagellin B [Sulfuricurvum sp.]MCK9371606.1 flagellin B [Sulfuricurvum sp.]